MPSGDVIRSNAPGGKASFPAASSAVAASSDDAVAAGDVGCVGTDAVGDAVTTGTWALSPVSGSDGIVSGSAGGGTELAGVGAADGSAADRRGGAFRAAAPTGTDAAEPPAPKTSFVVVDRVANPPGTAVSVVSTSVHLVPAFTRIGSTCCVQVNDPSGFAIVVLVAVNDVSTRTGCPVTRARRWASFSSIGAGPATDAPSLLPSSSTSTVSVPTPSADATTAATTAPARLPGQLPGHRKRLADNDKAPAPFVKGHHRRIRDVNVKIPTQGQLRTCPPRLAPLSRETARHLHPEPQRKNECNRAQRTQDQSTKASSQQTRRKSRGESYRLHSVPIKVCPWRRTRQGALVPAKFRSICARFTTNKKKI
ncbi:hypothetical protein [Streptodolium elevatio]|uniref:Uncharacterized protein n=1 Tax=Streptodolium elevatio TaxID=3157996 RepID=A0ABV3DGS5_9ACTN